jgi:acetyl-CoA synthetase
MAALRELTTAQLLQCGIDVKEAADVAAKLARVLAELPASGEAGGSGAHLPRIWQRVYSTVLQPGHPFSLHKLMFDATYQGWDAGKRCGLDAVHSY